MWRSGTWSVISASHSSSLPAISASHRRRFSSSCTTSLTPSMNSGNDSNCVHWSYATVTGTSTTMSFSMRAMSFSLRGRDEIGDWTPPRLEEVVRVEDVVLCEGRRRHSIFALDDRDARLATHGACKLHDQRLWLRRDATHCTTPEPGAAKRGLPPAGARPEGPHAGPGPW